VFNKYLPVSLLLLFVLGGCDQKINDPGGYVDVGGYLLYYEMYGSGSPTVIFENGSGSDLTDWKDVAPEIAKTNKVNWGMHFTKVTPICCGLSVCTL
jgi:hypothetical protein